MKLPPGTLIVLADGQRHLILENHGQAVAWDLGVHHIDETRLRPVGEQGVERPGRYPIAGGRRTAVEQTDWKAMDRAAFAKQLAHWINDEVASTPDRNFVLVAEAQSLGLIRKALSKQAADRVLAEMTADYVDRPLDEIAAFLKAS